MLQLTDRKIGKIYKLMGKKQTEISSASAVILQLQQRLVLIHLKHFVIVKELFHSIKLNSLSLAIQCP